MFLQTRVNALHCRKPSYLVAGTRLLIKASATPVVFVLRMVRLKTPLTTYWALMLTIRVPPTLGRWTQLRGVQVKACLFVVNPVRSVAPIPWSALPVNYLPNRPPKGMKLDKFPPALLPLDMVTHCTRPLGNMHLRQQLITTRLCLKWSRLPAIT